MVVLHFKRNDLNQFLYQTHTGITIDELLEDLVAVNNFRLKLDRAAVAIEDLASKGPLKSEGLRGLNEKTYDDYLQNDDITVRDGLKAMPPVVGERKAEDKDHFRTGWLLSEEMTKKLLDQSMAMK
jgi:hypothetical protein